MTRFEAGLIVWLLRWIVLGFLPFELAAVFWAGCPWPTLSRTAQDAEAWEPARIILLVFLAVLTAHISFRLSPAALIAVVVCSSVVVAVHFAFGTP